MRLDGLWTVRGSVALPFEAVETVIAHIALRLERLKLDHIEQGVSHLTWRQGFIHFIAHLDWELLGGIDSGEIVVTDDARLSYRLCFRHVLSLCLMASIFAGLFVGTAPDATPMKGLQWALLAIFWLFGANYAVTVFQVRRFLRRTIDIAVKSTAL